MGGGDRARRVTAGFAAAESRGGLVAATLALLAAFIVFKRARLQVLAVLAVVVAVGAAWFAVNPDAWQRISSFDTEGNGRTELWEVAWRMSVDHPVAGVGLGNFPANSLQYVREPGSLKFVELIAGDRPIVAHSTYLQLLSENGIVGLALYMALVLACLSAARRAARRFDALGERALATLSRAALVAGISMLGAGVFLTGGPDKRVWIVLALGPVLAGIARRQEGPAPPSLASSSSMPTP